MPLKRKRQEELGHGRSSSSRTGNETTAEAEPNDPDREPPPKRLNTSRSLFVHSLPADATTESLVEYFSQSYPLKHATVVVDPATKKSRGYGFVTFADAEDAVQAKEELDGSLFKGKKIKVDVAEPRHRETADDDSKTHQPSSEFVKAKEERRQQREGQPPPKLIIRNLPWSIDTNEKLAQLFMSYGKIKQATLPKSKPGLSPGFGFVLLRGRKNAERAMAAVNGKVIDGRTLAVDWAVQKDLWEAAQNQESAPKASDSASLKSEEDEDGVALDHIPPSDAEHEELSSEDEKEDLDLDDEEDELDEDDFAEEEELDQPEDRSSTMFVRNLPFTTTDDSLYEHFKAFGAVRYARVVMDNETERSRGTGFVCFYNLENARDCLRNSPKIGSASSPVGGKLSLKHSLLQDTQADTSGLYTLEGRVLQVSAAVGKGEAQRLTEEGHTFREARDKDKRRLYLLSEGTISTKSPMYAEIAPAELKMREDSAKQRQTLIRNNPSLHLSLTRLAIRNIPRFVTSKDLKALARAAVVGFAKDVKDGRRVQLSKEELSRGGEVMKEAEKARKAQGKGVVKQAKVVFEGREGHKVDEASGAGKSRGYGFVEFQTHRLALMALRFLNGYKVLRPRDTNNSTTSATSDRPKQLIVEFAIENQQVVARRGERERKAREKPMGIAEGTGLKPEKRLSKNQMRKKAELDARKQHGDSSGKHPTSQMSDRNLSNGNDESSKASKRQKIIGRKRAMRKARRKSS